MKVRKAQVQWVWKLVSQVALPETKSTAKCALWTGGDPFISPLRRPARQRKHTLDIAASLRIFTVGCKSQSPSRSIAC